jgi:Zn-dependent peptidase ImmA (M78 family)/transcriptional regulator with XRE-family HTH domain
MESKNGLPVTSSVVAWARVRAGYSLEDASRYFKKIALWEDGSALPSYPQLEQMAEKFKCPVAVFFFPEPPELPDVEKSFRTVSHQEFETMPRTVRGFLRRGQAMQVNLAELNDGRSPAGRLITRDLKFETSTSLRDIADGVRAYLGVSLDQQVAWKTADQALEAWRRIFAEVGIFVFKDAFHAEGYFGFCLYDEEFPIVYLNNSSAKTRQIFTLFHELGHLLFHTSGIDVLNDNYVRNLRDDEQKIEIICNGLANMILVPDDAFDRAISGQSPSRDLAARLAMHFCVSREVIYRKLLDRGLIQSGEYEAAVKYWSVPVKKSESNSGNYYNTHFSYLGSQYIDLAFRRYYQQRFDDVQLAEYLNIKPKNLPTFEAIFSGRA